MSDVKVYLLPIEKVDSIGEEYFSADFKERLDRSKRFRSREDTLRCLGVAVLLKEVLGLKEQDIKLSEHGKPYSDSTFKKFSISHSGDYVALAVSEAEVGVDIEKNDVRHFSVAERVFAPLEQEFIHDDIKNRFFIIWTLKESASKLNGLGISMDYASFSVMPMINGKPIAYKGDVIFGKYATFLDYTLAVCSGEEINLEIIKM